MIATPESPNGALELSNPVAFCESPRQRLAACTTGTQQACLDLPITPQGLALISSATTDQRGAMFACKVGAATEIGAFEVLSNERIFYDGFDRWLSLSFRSRR